MIFHISPKLSVARDLPQTYRQTVPQTRLCNSKVSVTESVWLFRRFVVHFAAQQCFVCTCIFSRTLQFYCNIWLLSWYVVCQSSVCRLLSVTRVYCDMSTEVRITGHPWATGRAQDGERTLARDWRSTAEPRGSTMGRPIVYMQSVIFSK